MGLVEVVDARPPNFDDIIRVFPLAGERGVIFAYGGKVYAPGRRALAPVLVAHERVHLERQGDAPDLWWSKYLDSVQFRLEEEILAHRAEYRAYCRRHQEPGKRHRALVDIAGKLAAPLYGGIISAEDARREVLTAER